MMNNILKTATIIALVLCFLQPVSGVVENNFLTAVDTYIIYSERNNPFSSLRLETYRVGCEDCDLLQLLKSKKIK